MVSVKSHDDDELDNLRRSEDAPIESSYDPNYSDDKYQSLLDYNRRVEANIASQKDQQTKVGAGEKSKDLPPNLTPQSTQNGFTKFMRKAGSKLFGSRAGAKRWLMVGGFGGLGMVIGLGLLLFIIASFLKIPNLLADITTYESATLVRQVGQAADRAIQEKLAIDSEDTGSFAKLRSSLRGMRDSWDEKFLKQFSPESAIRLLKVKNGLELKYKPDSEYTGFERFIGKQTLQEVVLDGKSYNIPQRTVVFDPLNIRLPKLLDLPYLKSQAAFAKDFSPALKDSLLENNVNFIIRFKVAGILRRELGISLRGLILSKFMKATPDEARVEAEREVSDQVSSKNNTDTSNIETSDLKEAVEDIERATVETKDDPAKLLDAVKNRNGVPAEATQILASNLDESVLKNVVSFINPAYAIALPACIVYDGSIDRAGPGIDGAIASQQAAYYAAASFADQLKYGVSSKQDWQGMLAAAQAMSDKVGDYSNSVAFRRSNGLPYDTDNVGLSTEAGITTNYTLIDATPLLGGSAVGNSIRYIADKTCPSFTDLKVALVSGVLIQIATILADIPSGGGATAGEVAVEAGVDATAEAATKSFGTRFVEAFLGEKITAQAIGGKVKQVIYKAGLDFAKISVMTIVMKLFVMWRAGQFNNGLEQGPDFVNEIDSGANQHFSELMRRQMFGRPLTCAELLQTDTASRKFLADVNAEKSLGERYFAIDNPNSLLMRSATMVYGQFSGVLKQPLATTANMFTGPFGLGTAVNSFFGTADAAMPCSHLYYGNVQFGWSEDEEKLIDSNTSYLSLANQQILDKSNKEDEIAQKYAACFGYVYDSSGQSLDPTDDNSKLQQDVSGDGSLGSLLANGDIVRNSDGDVVYDQGLCSPQNLGVNNPDYGDLVFRWRLAMSYQTTVNQLTSMQTVSNQ